MFRVALRQAARRLASASGDVARADTARACSTSAQLAAAAESDSRLMAYALGALGAVPFVALTPSGFAYVQRLAAQQGHPLPFSPDDAAKLQARTATHCSGLDGPLTPPKTRSPQILYGASILSFLGAPHWGLAMANHGAASLPLANIVRYAWGVTPSLLAWPVPALPELEAQRVLVNSLGAAFLVDAAFMRLNLLPRFYFWRLRLPLSLVATSSLLLTAATRQPTPRQPAAALTPPPPKKGWW